MILWFSVIVFLTAPLSDLVKCMADNFIEHSSPNCSGVSLQLLNAMEAISRINFNRFMYLVAG